MSIESTKVNVLKKTITVTFKPCESEDFTEIRDKVLTIYIELYRYTGTVDELKSYKVKLEFPSIQIIKLLSTDDPYFLRAVTTLSSVRVHYQLDDTVGSINEGEFSTLNFEIHFTDCLLINGSTKNGQLTPVKSSDLFYYENNGLYIKLNECLLKKSATINIDGMQCVNCHHSHTNSKTSLIVSGDIPPELAISREVHNNANEMVQIDSINKPPVSSITGLPIPINTSGENASSINLSKITF